MRTLILIVFASLLLPGCAAMQKAADSTGAFANKAAEKVGERTAKVSEAAGKLEKKEASPEEEANIGRVSASMLLGAAPLVRAELPMRYINQLGGWIARHTSQPDIKWRFGILDSANINAFAAPDGYILITRGLMTRLNNEAELAGVIAHEMAHVIRRHYIIAARKKDEAGAWGNLGAAMVEVVGIPGKGVMPVFNLAQNIYGSGLDKEDEYEADRLGMIYATRAGYDPFGLPRVLSMYASNASEDGFDLLVSTHPSPLDRLKQIDTVLGNKLAAYESDGITDSAQFAKAIAQLRSAPALKSTGKPTAKPTP